MSTRFLNRPRRTVAAAGLVLASVAGVLVATSSGAQAAHPDYPNTYCYASKGKKNPFRAVLTNSLAYGGIVTYEVRTEEWSRAERRYVLRSSQRVGSQARPILAVDATARCFSFTNYRYPYAK